ncbi:MAG: tetratricopeptide repeat protein [Chloroflexi bacterium]|nr:tetratricopeptide repeat protein [Chloroflexota bacterium]
MPTLQLSWIAVEAREALDDDDVARAAAVTRAALIRYPRWVEGYWLLGQILLYSRFVPEASSCFWAVANATPDDPRPYETLAGIYEDAGEKVAAERLWRQTLEIGGMNPQARRHLAQLTGEDGSASGAEPTDAGLAHASFRAGRSADALQHVARGLRREPDRLDLFLIGAQCLVRLKEFAAARQWFQAILDHNPDCLKALAALVFLEPERSAERLQQLALLDPEQHTLVWLRSQLVIMGQDVTGLPVHSRVVSWIAPEAPSLGNETSDDSAAEPAPSADSQASSQDGPVLDTEPSGNTVGVDGAEIAPAANEDAFHEPEAIPTSGEAEHEVQHTGHTISVAVGSEMSGLSSASTESSKKPEDILLADLETVWPEWLVAPEENGVTEGRPKAAPRHLPLQLGPGMDLESLAWALEQHLRNTALQGGLPLPLESKPPAGPVVQREATPADILLMNGTLKPQEEPDLTMSPVSSLPAMGEYTGSAPLPEPPEVVISPSAELQSEPKPRTQLPMAGFDLRDVEVRSVSLHGREDYWSKVNRLSRALRNLREPERRRGS